MLDELDADGTSGMFKNDLRAKVCHNPPLQGYLAHKKRPTPHLTPCTLDLKCCNSHLSRTMPRPLRWCRGRGVFL